MCLARSQDVLLVRRQHVEGRVARSGNGFVEDLRPPRRDLPYRWLTSRAAASTGQIAPVRVAIARTSARTLAVGGLGNRSLASPIGDVIGPAALRCGSRPPVPPQQREVQQPKQ